MGLGLGLGFGLGLRLGWMAAIRPPLTLTLNPNPNPEQVGSEGDEELTIARWDAFHKSWLDASRMEAHRMALS